MKFPVKTVAIVIAIIVIIVIASYALGFLTGPVNNPCPPGQCPDPNSRVYFSVTFSGFVVNPTWNILYATLQATANGAQPCGSPCGQANGIAIAISGPPTLGFKPPRLDFWTNNYKLTGTYTVTFPSGAAFSYPFTEIDGSVPGSNLVTWSQVVYGQGPHGTYTVSLVLNYAQTGCSGGCSVSGQIQATNSGTI